MPVRLKLTEKAEKEMDDAFQWYEVQEPGLGKEFIRCIDAKIANIYHHPLHHPLVKSDNVRRALIRRFPFSIYFIIEENLITVFAILHQRREPENWKSRV